MIFKKLMTTDEAKILRNMVGLFPELCFRIYNEIWNQVSFMLASFLLIWKQIFFTHLLLFNAKFYKDQILSNLAAD